VAGIWLAPADGGGDGMAIVINDSEEGARRGAEQTRQMFESGQAPPDVQLKSVEVREVLARF
jgi:hypothetical protein